MPIIEISGPTSVGKSTFISSLLKNEPLNVELMEEEVVTYHRKLKNLPLSGLFIIINDIRLIVPYIFQNINKVPQLIYLFWLCLLRKDSIFMRVNIFRNYLKKLAIISRLRKIDNSGYIFVMDEGPIHALNNIFCYTGRFENKEKLKKTITSLSLPDVFLQLETSSEEIVRRAITRTDAPWEGLSDTQWLEIIHNTSCIYEIIKIGLAEMDEKKTTFFRVNVNDHEKAIEKVVPLIERLAEK